MRHQQHGRFYISYTRAVGHLDPVASLIMGDLLFACAAHEDTVVSTAEASTESSTNKKRTHKTSSSRPHDCMASLGLPPDMGTHAYAEGSGRQPMHDAVVFTAYPH